MGDAEGGQDAVRHQDPYRRAVHDTRDDGGRSGTGEAADGEGEGGGESGGQCKVNRRSQRGGADPGSASAEGAVF